MAFLKPNLESVSKSKLDPSSDRVLEVLVIDDSLPDHTLKLSCIDGPRACTCSRQCARLLWLPHCKIIEACASLRTISSFHRWVESEERCELYYRLRGHEPPAGHSWIHGRWIGHPHESGNFTAPIVSTDYCFDHRNQEPETLVNLLRSPGAHELKRSSSSSSSSSS